MKILFLDIDGVLNSTRTAVAFGADYLDPVALKLLRGLQTKHRLRIVLSSSWRLGRDAEGLAELEQRLGLEILDTTPVLAFGVRGHEIAQWVNSQHVPSWEYVILDDDQDFLTPQIPRLVQTDPHEGLTWKEYVKICELLGFPV